MQSTTQAAVDTTHTLPLAEPQEGASQASGPGRLLSLDVFRGLTVLAMILVNNPGDWGHIYGPLEHAAWHGCTPTDLIFPFFLFIVGVSLVYALGGVRERGGPRRPVLARVARRAAVLVGLGLFLALFPKFDFAAVRIPGVLQRIGLVFLACGFLYLTTARRTWLLVLAVLLVGYNLLLLLPAPGQAVAQLLPGHDLVAWLDRTLLTEAHLWKSSRTWDPEGLLSTLPAIATGLLGVVAGEWLRRPGIAPAEKVVWLFIDAALLIGLGLIWNSWLPINKSLWTSSYVLYSGGLAVAGLAALYWLCDVQGWRRWTAPFMVFGVNAIVAFFGSSLVARSLNMLKVMGPTGGEVSLKDYLYHGFIAPWFTDPRNASLAGALSCVLIWALVLSVLYRRRIIVKV
jgi:predicted acyltransferase